MSVKSDAQSSEIRFGELKMGDCLTCRSPPMGGMAIGPMHRFRSRRADATVAATSSPSQLGFEGHAQCPS